MKNLNQMMTPVLIKELLSRFHTAVLIGDSAETPYPVLRYCGDTAAAKGWVEFASDILTDELRLKIEMPKEGEHP